MAREVVVYTWCDPCFGNDGNRTEGEEVTVALGELGISKPLTLSLCPEHRVEFYDDLRDLLKEFGQKTEGTTSSRRSSPSSTSKTGRPSREDLTCSDCGHMAPNKNALATHVRSMHSTTLAEQTGAPTPHECPECGRHFERPQGLAAHRRTVHGVKGKKVGKKKVAPAADETLV